MTPDLRVQMARAMTEDELLTAILEAAGLMGWRRHHDRRSDKAIQQGDAGFPDLVLARDGRILILELKDERSAPTEDQWSWIKALGIAKIVRPRDLDHVLELLRSGG